MAIQLNISPRLVKSISTLYNDINRVFMEYIDNAIDSAEEFYDGSSNSYKKNIEISLRISGDKRDGKVIIRDNCCGISNFTKVVQSVGDSDKKAQPWTNGQFGYGIYSFMAVCEKIEILSKLEGEQLGKYIPIKRSQFDKEHQSDVQFPDPLEQVFPLESGTDITLSGFDLHLWKEIDLDEIKSEIEKHFELLLNRKNILIKIINSRNVEFICKQFDYEACEGEVYEEIINDLLIQKGKDDKGVARRVLISPINIFLKVLKGKTINKTPIFVIKGRRISEVKEVKSFKSKHKSDIWGHPCLTGYIDLGNSLEPTLARNDFKNTPSKNAVFSMLENIEELVSGIITDINRESDRQHYKNLEDKLNQALSKLAKLDKMRFRTEILSGNDFILKDGAAGQSMEEGFGMKDREGEKSTNGGLNIGLNEGDGIGPTGKEGEDLSSGRGEGKFGSNEADDNPFDDGDLRGSERKRSGFNIKIVDGDPIVDSETNKPIRSQVIGSDIRIFREHEDFIDRVQLTRTKEMKITQRLITYLAGEITIHYKDKLQTRHGQPDYNKNMFVNLVEFIYEFESILKDLVGKNLSEVD